MKTPGDDIDWVRHVNGRWIVRESLREDAGAFLGYLASTDPARLRESCRRARLLTSAHPCEDPKPWFYGGLFSVASPEETLRFLMGHDFTAACVGGEAVEQFGNLRIEGLRPDTAEKIRRVREGLARFKAGASASH